MTTYLVTGASRGLGLAYAKHLSQRPEVTKVIATTRSKPSAQLADAIARSNGKIVHVILDVATGASVSAVVPPITAALGEQGLDVLINNVGIQEAVQGGIENMREESLAEIFNSNVVGTHRVIAAMMPLLRKGTAKKVVNISTTVGSINMAKDFAFVPQPQYKITKAAVNMLTVQYALDYEKEGFTFVALSPGWVQTELGGSDNAKYADLPIDVAAKAVIDQITAAGTEKNGAFLNVHVAGWNDKPAAHRYDGKSPPW